MTAPASPKATFESFGARWGFDPSAPRPLSIALDFGGAQPNAFGLPGATATAVPLEGSVCDTQRGGAVNCNTLLLNPHGNGTHTECVGHVVDDRVTIRDIADQLLVVARLISVTPVEFRDSGETDAGAAQRGDRVITRRAVQNALRSDEALRASYDRHPFAALVVRTLPNDGEKPRRQYAGTNPPFLTLDAVRYIRGLGVDHLLLDVPSADREDDGGRLAVHREFWGLRPGQRVLDAPPSRRTITELVYVPDELADGWYVLSLQIPDFAADAAPSRPLVYAVTDVSPIPVH